MSLALVAADLVAITLLVFGLFVPRHQRRDLVVAFLTVNIGVLAVTTTLSAVSVSMGVGLGLFGVLSIIRLRSEELTQHEVAYYFAALALGLLGGTSALSIYWGAGLMAAILAALFIGDHPLISKASVRQQLVVDRAYDNPAELRAHVERVIGGEVTNLQVIKTDLVNDSTVVDVRYSPERVATRSKAASR